MFFFVFIDAHRLLEILKFYASVKNCENDNTDDNDTCIVQTFTAWVNSHLRKAGTQIENIEEDFRFVQLYI